jgi:hypothetical protein
LAKLDKRLIHFFNFKNGLTKHDGQTNSASLPFLSRPEQSDKSRGNLGNRACEMMQAVPHGVNADNDARRRNLRSTSDQITI